MTATASLLLPLLLASPGPGPHATSPGGRVVVLPFANESGDPDLDWVGEALALALTDRLLLAGVDGVEAERRREAVQELALAPEGAVSLASAILVGRRLGVARIVTGEFRFKGDDRKQIDVVEWPILAAGFRREGAIPGSGRLEDLGPLAQRLTGGILASISPTSPAAPAGARPGCGTPAAVQERARAFTIADPRGRRSHLEKAIERDPSCGEALVDRARLDIDDGRPEEALTWLDRVQPDRVAFPERYWLARGDALAARGEKGVAIQMYRASLSRRPLPSAHFRLAALLFEDGRLAEARDEIEAGLAADASDPDGLELRDLLAGRALDRPASPATAPGAAQGC